MSYEEALKKILYNDLKEIRKNMYKFSCVSKIKNIMIEMKINGDEFEGNGFAVKPDKVNEIEQNKNCRSCLEGNIYTSRFSVEDGYSIHFGDLIKERGIDEGGLEEIIKKIEFRSMEVYEITIYLYLDRNLKSGYKIARIYFNRNIDCVKGEEISNKFEENTFFGRSSLDKTETGKPISFEYIDTDEQYEYSKDHRFRYMIY